MGSSQLQRFFISLTFSLTFLLGCQITQKVVGISTNEIKSKDDGLIKFTCLQINDVYEISPLKGGEAGGMARVATLKQKLQEENPNTLFVLAGDFLNPSLYGTIKYEGEKVSGRQMIEVMNAAGVDLVAFGNHEFDLKEKQLQDRINLSEFQWIGTNVLQNRVDSMPPFSSTNKANYVAPFYREQAGQKKTLPETYSWQIKDADGTELTIGLFSATINSNDKKYVTYEDYKTEAIKAYLELACQSDFVLGLTHLSIEEDMALAALLPKVPLLMGGHEHHQMKVEVGAVTITKADANALSAWVHRFEFNKNTGEHTLKSELVAINDSISEEPTTQKVVNHWEGILHKKLKEVYAEPEKVIYQAAESLDGKRHSVRNHQTNLGQLICAGIADATNTKAALTNSGCIRIDDELEGAIQAIDVFRILPYQENVTQTALTGSALLEVLDYGLVKKLGTSSYIQTHNLTYNGIKKTGTILSKSIVSDQTYLIGLSDYFLEELITAKVLPKKSFDKGIDSRLAIINYLDQL